jgi:uncharacterized protein (TIGR03083 family)
MSSLATYVAAWKSCAADVEELLRSLDAEDWSRPTDLPGWTVRDVAAHLAALESVLAGDPGPDVETGHAGGTDLTSAYTQAGVDARADRTPEELVEEFTDAVLRRAKELDEHPPVDPEGMPPYDLGEAGWTWGTLLRNRVVDLWVHEQDIRRAVGRPGGLDTPGAQTVAQTFVGALPFVIGKRAGAEPGSSVVVAVDGHLHGYTVDDRGRCRPTDEVPARPTVRLEMDTETLTVLGAGRRDPLMVDVAIGGDRRLGEQILQSMAVTP